MQRKARRPAGARAQKTKRLTGRRFFFTIQTMEDLKSIFHESGYMLSAPVQEILEETGSISYPDLFKLLNSDRDFVLDQYFPMSIVRGSYRKIRTETCVVGEMVFSTPHDGSFVSDPFIYELFFWMITGYGGYLCKRIWQKTMRLLTAFSLPYLN